MRLAIRMPDHLGDAVMALSAVRRIAAAHPGTGLYGPGFLAGLLAATGAETVTVHPRDAVPQADWGVILKPSLHAAWRWRHLRRRTGLAGNGRAFLLSDPVGVRVGEHRRDGFDRVADAVVGPAPGAGRRAGPRVTAGPEQGVAGDAERAEFGGRADAFHTAAGFVALNPWSPSPTVRWPNFRALADRLAPDVPVVFFGGPGEEEAVRAIAGPHRVLAGQPLPELARTLRGAALFVSNDSGAAHFADALGVPVVMVHGSTDPALTGTGEAVTGGPIWCGPCYRKACPLGLRCLTRIPVDAVEAAVRERLRHRPTGVS